MNSSVQKLQRFADKVRHCVTFANDGAATPEKVEEDTKESPENTNHLSPYN